MCRVLGRIRPSEEQRGWARHLRYFSDLVGGAVKAHFLLGDGSTGFTGLGAPSLPSFSFCHSSVSVPLAATSATSSAGTTPTAYPQRRPPCAGSPRFPAPPGQRYWLVTSETPMAGAVAASHRLVLEGGAPTCCGAGRSTLLVCSRRS